MRTRLPATSTESSCSLLSPDLSATGAGVLGQQLIQPPAPTEVIEGDVRLNGGIVDAALKEAEGRVEVYHNGAWGTICDHGWRLTDAVVTCNQLGFDYGSQIWPMRGKTSRQLYGTGDGPVWLSDLKCNGDEKKLVECPSFGWGVTGDCDHSGDAGVYCYNAVEPAPVSTFGGTGTKCGSLCACYPCGTNTAEESVTPGAGFETCMPDGTMDTCGPNKGSVGDGCYTLASQKCEIGRASCRERV